MKIATVIQWKKQQHCMNALYDINTVWTHTNIHYILRSVAGGSRESSLVVLSQHRMKWDGVNVFRFSAHSLIGQRYILCMHIHIL